MLSFLLLSLAAAQAQPRVPDPANAPPDSAATPVRPGGQNAIEGDFRILEPGPKQQDMVYASAGGMPRFLAVGCERTATISVLVALNANVGYQMPGALMGGQRVRYSFDGGREQSNRWAAVGDAVIARAAASRPLEFIRGLRGSRSMRFRTEGARNVAIDITFRYADPAPVIDEVLRRCGVTLPPN